MRIILRQHVELIRFGLGHFSRSSYNFLGLITSLFRSAPLVNSDFISRLPMPANITFRLLFVAVMLWLSADSIVVAQKGGDPLEPGKTIERDLAGGESHSYLITLATGQVLQAVIAQRQTDLTATLFGPDGRQVGQFDGLWYGPEPVCHVAEASGSYRLEIRPFDQAAAREFYQLKVEGLRAP